MATQNLTPIVSSSIRYDKTPIDEVPGVVFPYPQTHDESAPQPPRRSDSDKTLTNGPASLDQAATTENSKSPTVPNVTDRPTVLKKFGTEILSPVGTRPVMAQKIRSTGAHPARDQEPLTRLQDPTDSSSDSDSSADEDEPTVDLSNVASNPDRRDLAPAHLNRARMRPVRDRKKPRVDMGNDHFKSSGKVAKDGRLNVKISETANTGYLAKALGSALQGHLHPHAKQARQEAEDMRRQFDEHKDTTKIPQLNIVIMVIGSRGDVQPFLKIGQILQNKYGHRVRIATHPAFRKFVQEEIGLEFFSIGGDPSELMSFMVRNPGLIPSFETLTSGEVGRRRDQMFEMFNGFWRACVNTTDDEKDTANLKLLGNKRPFIADAIIANPVSFAHYHCAEKLGVPLQLVFTFPYTPTTSFPHPLANVKSSNVDREYTNYMSYPLVELMQWQGLGDIVNRFRVKTLGLEPLSTLWAPGQLTRMRVPMTYLWSPGLVPKPEDWGPEVDIAGYVFLDLAKSYEPPEDLVKFLKRDDTDNRPIIYIGFGSISGIKDPRAFCELIFQATEQAGVRAVVSRGWGGMGDGMDIPDGVFMIDNVPHDWLFPQLDAVVHHGGAGTCAIGMKLGLPTMIVPFFGDQPFWASMIVRAGAGAKEVWPLKKLTVERFVAGIKDCLEPSAKEAAQEIAKSIEREGDGAQNAIDSFHRGLILSGKHSMRCGVFDDKVAVWHVKHTDMKLSALAADLLVENKQLRWHDLELLRHKKWTDFSGPGEPITGVGGVVVGSLQEAIHGVSMIEKSTKIDYQKAKRRRSRKQSQAAAVAQPDALVEKIREGEQVTQHDAMARVNLTGEAEPVRKPTIAGVVGDEGRPAHGRADTTSSLQGPTGVVLAKDVGKGVGHSLKAIALLPSDMLNAITLGFRNAPRLYGDRTVRPPPQNIKGFRQGVSTAGKEMWYGVYDGAIGVVRIPYLDVSEDGVSGLPKGVARGLGGLVLKPVAGTLGLVNYTNRGVFASIRRLVRDTEKTERWIRRARLTQGAIEVKKLREEQQDSTKGTRGPARPRQDGQLEEARTLVLSRWTSNDRRQVEQAREKENRTLTLLPSRHSKPDRSATV